MFGDQLLVGGDDTFTGRDGICHKLVGWFQTTNSLDNNLYVGVIDEGIGISSTQFGGHGDFPGTVPVYIGHPFHHYRGTRPGGDAVTV